MNKRRTRSCFRLTVVWAATITNSLLMNTAQAGFEDYLSKRWYVTEIAVFARSSIQEDNTLEQLTATRPARLSSRLGAYSNPINTASLRAATQRMLGRVRLVDAVEPNPTFTLPLGPQPAIDPTTGEALPGDLLETFLDAMTAYEEHLTQQHLHFNEEANPRLETELARLLRRRNHKIVWRGSWLQAVPPRSDAQPLFFQGGHDFGDRRELEGSIALSVGRYLHLGLDLWYHDPEFAAVAAVMQTQEATASTGTSSSASKPIDNADSPIPVSDGTGTQTAIVDTAQPLPRPNIVATQVDQGLPRYMHLAAKRRMRSGDLHYIDHPKFGILVRIDRIEPPADLLALHESLEASQK